MIVKMFTRLWFLLRELRVVLPSHGVVAHRQPLAPHLDPLPALAEHPECPSQKRWSAPTAPSGVSPPTPGRARPPPARAAGRPPWPQRCRRWCASPTVALNFLRSSSKYPGETETGLPEQRQ